MQAALWDLVWERGGGWTTRVTRRAHTGVTTEPPDVVLTLAPPCTLEVRNVDAPSSTPPVLAVNATVDPDGAWASYTVTREQIEALSQRRYEHRIVVTDAASSLPVVLIRGYVTVRDTVGG